MQIKHQYLDHKFSWRTSKARIEWIVVHYSGIATAQGQAAVVERSIRRSERESSTHYIVGVDLVERKRDPTSKSVGDRDWYFTDTVIQDGAQLVAKLADTYGIPMDRIVRHFDVTGKRCPRPFVGNDVNEVTGENGEYAWQKFLIEVESRRH